MSNVEFWAETAQRYMAEVQSLMGRLSEAHARVETLAGELARVTLSEAHIRVQVLEAEAEKASLTANFERLSADFEGMSGRLMQLEVENEQLRNAGRPPEGPSNAPEKSEVTPGKPKPAAAPAGVKVSCVDCGAKFVRDFHHRKRCPDCKPNFSKEKT